MSFKNKALTAAIILSSLSGKVDAQSASKDAAMPQTTQQKANPQEKYLAAFENLYSNALYIKYRTDAGIKSKEQTPTDMLKKIQSDAHKYALNMLDLKKNKAGKEVMKATHLKQMGGVTVSDDGTTYTYPYIKNGQKRQASGELFGSASSFIEIEKEERALDLFTKTQTQLMKKSR